MNKYQQVGPFTDNTLGPPEVSKLRYLPRARIAESDSVRFLALQACWVIMAKHLLATLLATLPYNWPAANCTRSCNHNASIFISVLEAPTSEIACASSHLRPSVLSTVTVPAWRRLTSRDTPRAVKTAANGGALGPCPQSAIPTDGRQPLRCSRLSVTLAGPLLKQNRQNNWW